MGVADIKLSALISSDQYIISAIHYRKEDPRTPVITSLIDMNIYAGTIVSGDNCFLIH